MHLVCDKPEMISVGMNSKKRRKPKSKKSLDDFLSQKNHDSKVKGPIDDCEISLCTATTHVDKPIVQCTWKLSSQTARARQPALDGGLASFFKTKGLNQSMGLVQVEERNGSSFGKSSNRFGGITFGIASLLYQPERPLHGKSLSMSIAGEISEERNDQEYLNRNRSDSDSTRRSDCESEATKKSEYLHMGRRSVSCTFSTTDDSASIEVCMPPISEGYESGYLKRQDKEVLYEKVRLAEEICIKEEAMLEAQKRLVREKFLADEVCLVEMTRETKAAHFEKSCLLSKLAMEATNAEKTRNAEEIKLSVSLQNVLVKLEEERNIFKNIRLEEEKHLEEQEKRIAEKRRLLEDSYTMEQARLDCQTCRAEERLLEQARLAEERQRSEQVRLDVLTRQVEEARARADEARLLVEQETRYMDSLTFDDTFSIAPSVSMAPSRLNAEQSWDQHDISEIGEGESLGNQHWDELDASIFFVRGKNYLVDRKKVSSAPNLLRLITVELLEVDEPMMDGFCSHPKGRVQQMLQLEKRNVNVPGSPKMPPFIFCVNMLLPGPPNYHLVIYFAVDDLDQLGLSDPNGRTSKSSGNNPYSCPLQQFFFGDSDDYRNKVLKMIPRITEGSFLLKTAVGTKPFILGKYLKQTCVRGERFLEIIVDVGSSPTTQKLLGLRSVYKNKIVAGMAFVLEANEEESLPENILCSVELNNEDFDGDIPFFHNTM